MKWLKKRRARKMAEAHVGEAFRYMRLRFRGERPVPTDIKYALAEESERESLQKASETKRATSWEWCVIGPGGTVVYSDEPYQDYYTWVSTKKQTETQIGSNTYS